MSEQANNESTAATQAAEDLNTTPPNPSQAAGDTGWKMPEPVFRKTSGYLPQGFEKNYSQGEIKESVDDDTSTASMPRPTDLADVKPQPKITDTYEIGIPANEESTSAEPKKGGAAKVVFTIIGLLVAVGLVAAFIAVVYFLFFSPSSDRTF